MFIGTHTLLPVTVALTIDSIRIVRGKDELFSTWSLATIGFFGALPDICTPHLSLDARYTSWSHTMVFLIALLPLAALTSTLFPAGSRLLLSFSLWLAAALHLACDAASGGIAWAYPWRDSILGSYYIHPNLWPVSDALFVVATWLLLTLRRSLRNRDVSISRRSP